MTNDQLDRAMKKAQNFEVSLLEVDIDIFNGYGLPSFRQITATLTQVAAVIRWQCIYLNGNVDAEALDLLARVFRHKVLIMGD